jgi:hypothetical protein
MSRTVTVRMTHVGRGVFARRAFRALQIVAEIRGAVIREVGYESDYCMCLGDGTVLEPTAPFCYLNHSCEPNCVWFVEPRWDEEAGRETPEVLLQALVDIHAATELTIDYSWPADSAIECHCGGQRCRGWIVAEDELPQALLAGAAMRRGEDPL